MITLALYGYLFQGLIFIFYVCLCVSLCVYAIICQYIAIIDPNDNIHFLLSFFWVYALLYPSFNVEPYLLMYLCIYTYI